MIAYTENGKRMDYDEYINSDEWREKRIQREEFDNHQCALCHKNVMKYSTCHHMSYERLGHENVAEDIITLCWNCHERFHDNWGKMSEVDSRLVPDHWKYYSSEATLRFLVMHINDDYLLGGEYNMCKSDVIQGFIDEYYKEVDPVKVGYISTDDIKHFFKNRRLEHLIKHVLHDGMAYEDFLDEFYGQKGVAGNPNPKRSDANKAFKDMAEHNCRKAVKTLYSPQGRFLENLWDFYLMDEYRKKQKQIKEEHNNAET